MPTVMTRMFVATVLLVYARAAAIDVTCNGQVADDTPRLIAAIHGSSIGDRLYIHGTCVVNDTIPLLGDRAYVGDSRSGTTITQAAGSNLTALVASNGYLLNTSWTDHPVELAHLTIDANSKYNSNTSALVIRSWQTVLHDLHVVNSPVDGIRLTNLALDGHTGLKSSQVNGRISNCFVENSGAAGIRVLDTQNAVTDWNLLDSWVSNSGTSAVLLDNAAGWQVRGLHTYGTQQHAIFANRCFATSITDNYIEDFGHEGGESATWYGIVCHAQASSASVIANNRVHSFRAEPTERSTFVFVGVSGVESGGVGVVNVVGNTVREDCNRTGSVGLAYRVGNGRALEVGSSSNLVIGLREAARRDVGEKVTLVHSI